MQSRKSTPTPTVAEKFCADCGQTRPAGEFYRCGRAKSGLQSYCKDCLSLRQRANRVGITAERLREVLADPDPRCAICLSPEQLVLDHSHASGEYRSRLCQSCNLMLGHAKDSVAVLLAAAEYLRAHAAVP